MNTFSIKTFGCKVNQYDSQGIRENFIRKGYEEAKAQTVPAVYIVNTCAVTEMAEKKARYFINRLKRDVPSARIVVTGCAVNDKPKAAGTWGELLTGFAGHTRAFVKIQDGCNQYCSYCVLPYIRGRSRTRDIKDVVDEIKQLVSAGYKEIVLTGIHLGDYKSLGRLLGILKDIDGLLRVRLSSIEAGEITDTILGSMADNPKICRHLHIPLQSGSDAILRRMNRKYTYAEYKKIIDNIRNKIPDITFTTDIMVGFPGETENDFTDSCRAVEKIGFVKAHIFPYSPRPRTPSFDFPGRVPAHITKQRSKLLEKTALSAARAVKEKLVGSTQEVLVEKTGENSRGYISGYIPVIFDNGAGCSGLVKVKILSAEDKYLDAIIRNR